jgi:hypothetical protein
MHTALIAVGLGQIALAFASLCLPRILRWPQQLAQLQPLTRRVFWVYACYILGTNLCLGSVSAITPDWLLDHSPLARAVAGYAAAYWGARLAIQFVWFRGVAPKGLGYQLADLAMSLLFAGCTACYGAILFDLW